ncbi:MAG TPA: type II toxin-antitoxin system mRNA interferase toxin, RelE/StbE family [Cyanobacteria bacterium UBA12227]|nr:type II toxin-antitoxin system mRNA interferase toxin, RelE/StbE family [Cyanobacteria bacterium UBA12227]HAX87752.1 type II toxin-antitoxin system mRNA interferase toxin, RelE/StbE family [Cyanobacteria bacterium UBA11370]HBY75727.1 type II toxin-antitoxin system mRNA interferase toxin, RelE/StbE family [Cyanobacteria bacterium UBA11148]
MSVKWLRKALQNLAQAHAYIAKDDPTAAVRTMSTIQQAVAQLAEFPNMGRIGRVEGTRELVIPSTPYFVVYRVKGNTVQILRVLHSARRYPDG